MPAPSKFTKEQQRFLATFFDQYNIDRVACQKQKFKEDTGGEFLEKWPVSIPAEWAPVNYPPPPPPPPGADPSKQPPPPPSPRTQRKAYQAELDEERKGVC